MTILMLSNMQRAIMFNYQDKPVNLIHNTTAFIAQTMEQ